MSYFGGPQNAQALTLCSTDKRCMNIKKKEVERNGRHKSETHLKFRYVEDAVKGETSVWRTKDTVTPEFLRNASRAFVPR